MTEYVPLEKLLNNTQGSLFKLVVVTAKRALDVAEGAKPLVDVSLGTKPIEVVFKEIAEGRVNYKEGQLEKKE